MYCSKCGKTIKNESRFCVYCGGKIGTDNIETVQDVVSRDEKNDVVVNKRKTRLWITRIWVSIFIIGILTYVITIIGDKKSEIKGRYYQVFEGRLTDYYIDFKGNGIAEADNGMKLLYKQTGDILEISEASYGEEIIYYECIDGVLYCMEYPEKAYYPEDMIENMEEFEAYESDRIENATDSDITNFSSSEEDETVFDIVEESIHNDEMVADIETVDNDFRIEGDGYKTSEEAVLAYLKAFREGDVRAILETFAIETFAEEFVLEDYINSVGVYFRDWNEHRMLMLPPSNEFAIGQNIAIRCGALAEKMHGQYLYICLPNLPFNEMDYMSIEEIDGGARSIVSELGNPKHIQKINSLEFVEFVELIELNDRLPVYLESVISESRGVANVDEMGYECAKVIMNGEEYFFFMQTARYNDMWFNYELGGLLGTICNVESEWGGFICCEEYWERNGS